MTPIADGARDGGAGVDTAGHDVTLNGDVTGGGVLQKSGAGSLTLSGDNRHSVLDVMGGTVVIEFIFQYPGMGTALRDAVGSRDLFVIQAVVLIFACSYVLFNLAADVLSIIVTPRLRG